MTGRVVSVPERAHHCSPGWTYSDPEPGSPEHRVAGWLAHPPSAYEYPKGTVWECQCGRTWVSTGPPDDYSPGVTEFRPERRLERRRRLRKETPHD